MLYECVECKHQISADAWRCPNCGSKDAGSLAEAAYDRAQLYLWEREKDRTDPGWRQREAEEREKAARIAAAEREKEERKYRAKERTDRWEGMWGTFSMLYYAYLIPAGFTVIALIFDKSGSGMTWLGFIPVLNWMFILLGLLVSGNRVPIFYYLTFCIILWVILMFITKPKKIETLLD